jgi:MFS family permease
MVRPRIIFFVIAMMAAVARGPIFADLFHLYAAFTYNLDARAIGILATAGGCVVVPVGFLGGYLLDRFGRKRAMVPAFAGVTAAMLLLAVSALLHLSLAWYVAFFLLCVAAHGFTAGSIQTVGTDVAPPGAQGRFLGLWRFIVTVGGTISPIVFALLADTLGYISSFLFVSAAGLAVTLLLTRIPETGTAGELHIGARQQTAAASA